MSCEVNTTLLTTGEAARRLGVSPTWVRVLAQAGAVPCTRAYGGWFLFSEDDINRLVKERARRAR